jgi:hypothetical protein
MVDRMTYRQAKDILATAHTIEERNAMTQKPAHVSLSEVFSRTQSAKGPLTSLHVKKVSY